MVGSNFLNKNQSQRIVKSEYFKNPMVCENGFFFCFNLFNNMGKYIKNQFFEFFAKCGYEPWVKSLSLFFHNHPILVCTYCSKKKGGNANFNFYLG